MGSLPSWSQSVSAGAAGLWDRQVPSYSCIDQSTDPVAENRYERWVQLLSGVKQLKRRLHVAGVQNAAPLLRGTRSYSTNPEEWAAFLEQAFQTGWVEDRTQTEFPFEDVLMPVASQAFSRLRAAIIHTGDMFAETAIRCLERQLLAHLTFVASFQLSREFELFRFSRDASYALGDDWNARKRSCEIYAAFCQEMGAGGFAELLLEKPVLARLIGQSTIQWLDCAKRLCERFVTDLQVLQRELGWPSEHDEARVVYIWTDLSDRHAGGQTVAELQSAGGTHVFYKPRPVDGEHAFNEFAETSLKSIGIRLRTAKCVRRDTYGWCEPVAPHACETSIEVAEFYRNAGKLLAIFHLLSATDIHFENIIAAGSNPVPIDLETILSGWVAPTAHWSVLNVGLLPRLRRSPTGVAYDLSGLAAGSSQRSLLERRQWVALNSDQMRLIEIPGVKPSLRHRPTLNDNIVDPCDFVESICEGFGDTYSLLMASRDQLIASHAMDVFDGLSLRVMLRSTDTYTSLQLRLLHPEFLGDGIDRSIELEWLARPLTGPKPSNARARIYALELEAMERLDVPRFSTLLACRCGPTDDEPEEALLSQRRDSSTVIDRLCSFCQRDRELQIGLIKKSFEALRNGDQI